MGEGETSSFSASNLVYFIYNRMLRGKSRQLIILLGIAISIIGYLYLNMKNTTSHVSFHIPRTVTLETERHGVPFILHEYWHSRRIPNGMSKVIENHVKMNPEFDIYIYSEKEAIDFLKKHFDAELLAAYNGFKPSAYRSDLFRYCVLYIMGGVYIDTKMDFTVPLKDLIKDSQFFILNTKDKWCSDGRGVSNALIITPPRNEILRMAIDEIVKAYKERSYKEDELDITGPCLIGDILNRTKQAHLRDNARCECSEEDTHFVFKCDGKEVARSYTEYREEQLNTQKGPHYKNLYEKGDIYW